jgi:hypothetical protein
MNNPMNIPHGFSLASIAALAMLCSCEPAPPDIPTAPGVLFNHSEEIALIAPKYDALLTSEEVQFEWEVPRANYSSVAVFRRPVAVDNASNSITNQDFSEWIWTSGKSGNPGAAGFTDGYRVENGRPDYTRHATLLRPGMYYWAVWAWDSTGTRVVKSSKRGRFVVLAK